MKRQVKKYLNSEELGYLFYSKGNYKKGLGQIIEFRMIKISDLVYKQWTKAKLENLESNSNLKQKSNIFML